MEKPREMGKDSIIKHLRNLDAALVLDGHLRAKESGHAFIGPTICEIAADYIESREASYDELVRALEKMRDRYVAGVDVYEYAVMCNELANEALKQAVVSRSGSEG